MIPPENGVLWKLVLTHHPPLLRLMEGHGLWGRQPRERLALEKACRKTRGKFRFSSGKLQASWEPSASTGKFRWIKRILGKVSLAFEKNSKN